MPSVSRKQHRFMEAIGHDATFAKKVGVKQSVGRDFVDADKAAGRFQKKGTASMARKNGNGGMGSEKGISPRKAMASGEGGSFGVEPYHTQHGTPLGTHPDHRAHTGRKPPLDDGDRGAGPGVHHTKNHHPAQAAPDHGPHHVEGYGHHERTGRV